MEPSDRTHTNDASTLSSSTEVSEGRRVRRRVIVSGRVQGVYYRDTCRRVAQRLGLRGWVRNRADGTVEAVFEGDGGDVDEMLSWCRQGPLHASVTGVEVIEEPMTGEGPFRVVG